MSEIEDVRSTDRRARSRCTTGRSGAVWASVRLLWVDAESRGARTQWQSWICGSSGGLRLVLAVAKIPDGSPLPLPPAAGKPRGDD